MTIHDVSMTSRRQRRLAELSSRDPETALLNESGLAARLGEVVRQALADGTSASVVVGKLGSDRAGAEAKPLERLQALVRAGDELGRTRDGEIVWILPRTDLAGAQDAVARARAAISDLGATLTAGVCDLDGAADAASLYALADRALARALTEGLGTTAEHRRMLTDAVLS